MARKQAAKTEKSEDVGSEQTNHEQNGERGDNNKISENSTKKRNSRRNKREESSPRTGIFSQLIHVGKYVLLLLFVPPFLNYGALMREARQLEPPGMLYDIGFGQKMFLGCVGEGAPTVILDAPTGMSSDVWTAVQPHLSKLTRVCVYDRAGLGFSERPHVNSSESDTRRRWREFTVERMVDDLYRLISYSSQQPKPFILVGSEMGALVARFMTQIYETEVSDLVLIDPLVEDVFTYDSGVWSSFWYGHLVPSFQSLQLAAATGLMRLILLLGLIDQPITGEHVPPEVVQRQKYLMCNPKHLSSVVDEHHFVNETFSQMRTLMLLKSFPSNVSVTVITGNYYDEQLPSSLNKAWAKSQQQLMSRLHPTSNHIVVNGADHTMLYRNPQAVIEPIKRIIRQRRAKLTAQ